MRIAAGVTAGRGRAGRETGNAGAAAAGVIAPAEQR